MPIATELSKELLRLFALGEISATQVQSIAKAAWDDGWGRHCRTARRLAHLGGSRGNEHCSRDLFLVAASSGILDTSIQPYPVKIHDNSTVQVFLPHEILQHAIRTEELSEWCFAPDDFEDASHMAKAMQEWALHPDVCMGDEDLSRVLAVGVHADAVQYTSSLRAGSGRSLLVCSMNVVSSSSESKRARRFPLFVLGKGRQCECGCGGFHTTQHLFEAIAWSFKAMKVGIAPDCKHDTSPFSAEELKYRIAPGRLMHKGCLLNVRGDWEGLVTFFRLRWFTSQQFCFLCNATLDAGALCYKDFSGTAVHRGSLFSHLDYLEGCAAVHAEPCALFKAPGMSLQSLCIDSMHCADLGCFADALGSLFHMEVHSKQLHPTIGDGLVWLNGELKCFYRANQHLGLCSLHPLVESQLKGTGGHPFLRAKAAEARHLSEFGLILANLHRHGGQGRPRFSFEAGFRLEGSTDAYLRDLVQVFEGMCQYLRSVGAEIFDAEVCKEGMMKFLRAMSRLEKLWTDGLPPKQQMKQPFHLRQKAHLLEHLALDQIDRWGNPARWWCYRDESFVGSVKHVASKTKAPATLEVRIMQKLRMLEALGHRL
jgi:hypothetical protein